MTLLRSLLLVFAAACCSAAAPSPPRPATGIGVLILPRQEVTLTLHHAPGRGRSGELRIASLRHLEPLLGPTATTVVPVARKQGEWFSLFIDESEREGWIRLRPGWRFVPWEEWLVGKTAAFLKGLPHHLTTISSGTPPVENQPLPRDTTFRIVGIDGDRAFVFVGDGRSGWVRWRDRDGRFTITLSLP